MSTDQQPGREAARLALLAELGYTVGVTEPLFDNITSLAAHACGTPVALVTLVDEHTQWFASRFGLDVDQIPRELAFSNWLIADHPTGVFESPDLTLDHRFCEHPFVTGSTGARFFAGVPLRPDGQLPVGALCVIDRQPSRLNDSERERLLELAAVAEQLLRLRLAVERERDAVEESERYRADLERTNAELFDLATERDTLVKTVAHDLSSPLAAIRLHAESIATQVDEPVSTQTSRLRDLARDAEAMLSDLVRATQPGRPTSKLHTTSVQVAEIIDHSLAQVLMENPVDIDVEHFAVDVDPNAISRVLVNLVTNAVRHTPPETPITVSARQHAGLAVIAVADEGPGIDLSDAERLMEPYQRGRDAHAHGSGLGLAIARALVESHGGRISIDRNEPRGTLVTVAIPKSQPDLSHLGC
ncbi:MAG: ATP-binding protein [Ilumatobacter sp.]